MKAFALYTKLGTIHITENTICSWKENDEGKKMNQEKSMRKRSEWRVTKWKKKSHKTYQQSKEMTSIYFVADILYLLMLACNEASAVSPVLQYHFVSEEALVSRCGVQSALSPQWEEEVALTWGLRMFVSSQFMPNS